LNFTFIYIYIYFNSDIKLKSMEVIGIWLVKIIDFIAISIATDLIGAVYYLLLSYIKI